MALDLSLLPDKPQRKSRLDLSLLPDKPDDEESFQSWYAGHAKERGLSPNPDDPEHFYDYRAAYKAGAGPGPDGHWPSQFKLEGHPRMVVDGVNTKTGRSARPSLDLSLLPDQPEKPEQGILSKAAEGAVDLFGMVPKPPMSIPPEKVSPAGLFEAAQKPFQVKTIDTTATRRMAGSFGSGAAGTLSGMAGVAPSWSGTHATAASPGWSCSPAGSRTTRWQIITR